VFEQARTELAVARAFEQANVAWAQKHEGVWVAAQVVKGVPLQVMMTTTMPPHYQS
jgi:hypothetical protein